MFSPFSRRIFRIINYFLQTKRLLLCTSVILDAVTLALLGANLTSFASSNYSLTARDCEADSDFVFIPGGNYIQGSDRQEKDYGYGVSAQSVAQTSLAINRAAAQLRQAGWFEREQERQTAYLEDICLSRNLVTNREYQQFLQATNYPVPDISKSEYQQQGFLVHPYSKVREFLWQDGDYPENTAKHPVVLISYNDALAYARWQSQQDPKADYRLPTAEEWEKAARGTQGNYFPWGNQWQNSATNAQPSGLNYTSAIATFPLSKSVYGIEDMAGNVFEYTSTLQAQGTRVLLKGCSWDDLPGFCRAAYQHTRPVDSKHILFGFRLVKIANED